ncbi:MAG TPA: ABC transporter permease, partial [Pyrinomonadaceae bacterium]|nr:ABC transporter permease [Pyrinomonadaceae bacterium]
MPYEIFLAFRYLRSRPKRRLARVTALLAVLGIAMGVAALIVALALANGFRDEMREKILQGTAHLTVLRQDGKPIQDNAHIVEGTRQIEGVVSASTTTYIGVLAYGPKRGPAYAVLRGIENDGGNLTQGRKWLKEGSFDSLFAASGPNEVLRPNVVIGAELATKLDASVGDFIDVIPGNPIGPIKWRLRVAGIFQSGLFEYDSTWAYIDFHKTAKVIGDSDASVISVQVNDPDNVKQIGANVLHTLGNDYTTIDWQQANQPLFTALALERRMGAFIVGLIIAIAVLNITTMLILVVVERRRDIAIISTLGATRTGVMLVFIIEGAVVGAIGAVAGVLLGLAACFAGNRYKLVSLPADVYSISNVPFNATINEVALAALIAFGLSVLATIYP